MKENTEVASQAGSAHSSVASRKASMLPEHKRRVQLTGGSCIAGVRLETDAGNQYMRVLNNEELNKMLIAYSGKTTNCEGRPVSLPHPGTRRVFPNGHLNTNMRKHRELDSLSPLCISWLFNAKREDALRAGSVYMNGEPMEDVDPDHFDPRTYFDLGNGRFQLPQWMREKRNYFVMINPNVTNVFDMTLPRPIASSVSPGPNLMRLFLDRFHPELDIDAPHALDCFHNDMTNTDQFVVRQVNEMAEAITTFDSAEASDAERVSMGRAKALLASGTMRNYGHTTNGAHVIEPRQVLKEITAQTQQVYSKVVAPFVQDEKTAHAAEELRIREDNYEEHAETDYGDEVFAALRAKQDAFRKQKVAVMEELATFHLARVEQAFESRLEAESIPPGYRAVWTGLKEELAKMPNKTANLAHVYGHQLTCSKRTVFGEMQKWLGHFFEESCARPPPARRPPARARSRPRARRLHRRPRLAADAGAVRALVRRPPARPPATCPAPTPPARPQFRAVRRADPAAHLLRAEGCVAARPTRLCAAHAARTWQATARRCAPSARCGPSCRTGSSCPAPPPPRRACRATRETTTARTSYTTR